MTAEAGYETKTIEHLGLVAGMFDELGIGELVDEVVPQDRDQRRVSVGTAMKAMVLNGLGFANRRLYSTPRFFRNKPTERLLGDGVTPDVLNDDTLGRALDTLHAFGVTEMFSLISSRAASRLGLSPRVGHLDSTSFHVDGRYEVEEDEKVGQNDGENAQAELPEDAEDAGEDGVIRVVQGYNSRDHRPDLNQVVLELISEGQASLPMVMMPLSGNTSDKTSFTHAIQQHIEQLQAAGVEIVAAARRVDGALNL